MKTTPCVMYTGQMSFNNITRKGTAPQNKDEANKLNANNAIAYCSRSFQHSMNNNMPTLEIVIKSVRESVNIF